ncbi:MAG: tetratricopeptide repeat protein [Chloroflexi bacterium]|nr:tetratricopeptide repeat protein [Chloroflexota bacterium]
MLTSNLPQQLTSFIGREKETAEVKRLLQETRLLTLTGTGGCGKTRLSLQVASSLEAEYPDGVWFVDLTTISDPHLLPQVVATTLDLREEPGRDISSILLDHLQPLKLLLVLDNCEHMVGGCAELAANLLRNCSELRILATSRQALGITGEIAWLVPSLSHPDPHQRHPFENLVQYEAVQLFLERALFSRPNLIVTPDSGPSVVRVCYRLDGIPLAIELAAARVKVLTIDQIASRLDNCFRILTGGSRTALPRQQTLRAAIDWSYDLLTEEEKLLLQRLSIFVGSWGLDAAEAICSDQSIGEIEVLDLLSQLIDKSLVMAEESNGEVCYRLLETIRQYANEKLQASGGEQELQLKHLDWYLNLAEQAQKEILSEKQSFWLDRLESEHDNLRAALDRSARVGKGAEATLRLSAALWRFWEMRGYLSEGRRWLKGALAVPSGNLTAARAAALNAAGMLAVYQGDYADAGELLNASLETCRLIGDKGEIALSLNSLGVLANNRGDYEQATALFEESLAIRRELGDRRGIANSLHNLGYEAVYRGDYSQAAILGDESLSLYRELSEKHGIAASLFLLGYVTIYSGASEQATRLYEESLSLYRDLGETRGIASSLFFLGVAAMHTGDYTSAESLYKESLSLYRELGDKVGMTECLEAMSALSGALEQDERAARLFGAAAALRKAVGAPLNPSDRARYEQSLATIRGRRGEESFSAFWTAGAALPLEDAIAYALNDAYKTNRSTLPRRDPLQSHLDAPAAPPPILPAPPFAVGLTRREMEVLNLVASGLTDAQIANELSVSPRTVQAHLYSIYNKIGVTTRSAATRYALDHHLV